MTPEEKNEKAVAVAEALKGFLNSEWKIDIGFNPDTKQISLSNLEAFINLKRALFAYEGIPLDEEPATDSSST